MQVLRESFLEQLGFGKQKSVSVDSNDGQYTITAKENIFGKITVTFKSKTPRHETADADLVVFDDSHTAIAWKRLKQPVMVTARPRSACITKQTVDFKQSTQNIDIIDCFERLLSAVAEANWGDRERLQLEVIALRAKYPRANRPLSSMLGKGLIECMNEFGAVVVYEPLDGEIEIKALTITGEGFIAQSYDRNNGLVSDIKYPTYPQRFAESLKASIDEILEKMFSSRRWSQADIVEFLDTCHAFSAQYDRSRPIVDLKPNSLIPTPVKDLAR